MTKNEIILIAEQAHFNSKTWLDIYKDDVTAGDVRGYLEAFAKLVADKEREECAEMCDDAAFDWHLHASGGPVAHYHHCADAIRARGENA